MHSLNALRGSTEASQGFASSPLGLLPGPIGVVFELCVDVGECSADPQLFHWKLCQPDDQSMSCIASAAKSHSILGPAGVLPLSPGEKCQHAQHCATMLLASRVCHT